MANLDHLRKQLTAKTNKMPTKPGVELELLNYTNIYTLEQVGMTNLS